MDLTNSEKLIAVFDMINERLYNIEKSNNLIINHLKNKCRKERKYDKDLFEYPINVKYCYHLTPNIEKDTCVYVSFLCMDEGDFRPFSVYNRRVFNIYKEFLPTILDNKQIHRLETHIMENPNRFNDIIPLTCEELNIESMFRDVDHYIMNAYVSQHCKKIKWILPTTGEHYDFIIKDVESLDDVVKCVSDVHNLFKSSLDKLASSRNKMYVVLCPNQYWANLEMIISSNTYDYNLENLSKTLNLKIKHVEDYQKIIENILVDEKYPNVPLLDDKIITESSFEIMNDFYNRFNDALDIE
jgi:hypothetical protein